ncbi:hypothetical protein B0H17DRAFT_1183859 [Mycena rosella]|uniref:CxC2-like cysteine cluster KDZ transposase-associated domain-containing protein n=1 Tax=Mycena rosella TaxID=1033263 RepID=A0AAD7CYC0_MYCRO|nr:hypothetical protein B0H17DRAFT_1183859 [Mycena rosella]
MLKPKATRRVKRVTPANDFRQNSSVHAGADLNEVRHERVTQSGTTTTHKYIRPEAAPGSASLKPPAPIAKVAAPAAVKAPPNRTQTHPVARSESVVRDSMPCAGADEISEVICHNCTQYRPSCKRCFVNSDRNNLFHWAEVWDKEKGFLVRHDIAALAGGVDQDQKTAAPRDSLGEEADETRGKEAKKRPATATAFTITDVTGIHATSVDFCRHPIAINKVAQLLEARIVPCTFTDPKTGVTFECLKNFQMYSLESKAAAYDYVGSLARLTDNSFTESVPDMYENILRTARMWGYLTTRKRLGQEHGVDQLLTHRPEGNLVLYCPSCPEPGFNTDKNMPPLPENLRHLNQQRQTLDRNFHCNKSTKNTDPSDLSLYDGKAYFPTNEFLNEQLAKAPKTEPKSTCNYLKAVNNQDRKKFKNMEITGIVNTQCSHVFVKASVDMQYGERYVNVDLSLVRAIEQKLATRHRGEVTFELEVELGKELAEIDEVLSYDAMCQYSVNIGERFEKNDDLKHLAHIVRRMRFSIPALHVQGHQEGCIYAYSTAYMLATTHFHGETAEHYWPELNQIGPQTRQMNPGHRQDTVINHHGDWNYKKLAKAVSLLLRDLLIAEELFALHSNQFLALCASHAEAITSNNWLGADRTPDKRNMKDVKSVYRYSKTRVPTQNAIYQKMLADEAEMPNSKVRHRKAAAFINAALKIQQEQVKVWLMVAANKEHPLVSTQRDIASRRSKLRTQLAAFRKDQVGVTPAMAEYLTTQAACEVEVELLGLPSEFPEAVKQEEEHSGVQNNTISQKQINDTQDRQDVHIRDWATRKGRWTRLDHGWDRGAGANSSCGRRFNIGTAVVETRVEATAMIRRKTGPRSPRKPDATGRKPGVVKKRRKDGWIWTFGKMGKMDAKELEEWTQEGDRVQWFRAEAEMQRWQEQLEAKLAELRTTIRSFAAYKIAWAKMADLQASSDIGHIAYAKQKSWMFGERETLGREALRKMPKYAALAEDDTDLVAFVEAERAIHQATLQAILEAGGKDRLIAGDQLEESDDDCEDALEGDWEEDDGGE